MNYLKVVVGKKPMTDVRCHAVVIAKNAQYCIYVFSWSFGVKISKHYLLNVNPLHLAVTGENGLVLLVGSNYSRSYYLQSCTRMHTCFLPGFITHRYMTNRKFG